MELILLASLLGLGLAMGQMFESPSLDNQEDQEDDKYEDDSANSGEESDEPLDEKDPYSTEGTSGDDMITGWNNIAGYAGNDYIRAMNFGGEFQAVGTVDGGAGNDTIIAQAGRDSDGEIYGGDGSDTIVAHAGAYISGGEGDDSIFALATQHSMGEILTGGGEDLIAFVPFSENNGSYSELEVPQIKVQDFDPTKDKLGIIVDPEHVSEMQYTRESVNNDTDSKFTFFMSNSLNGIEYHSPLEVIIAGVNQDIPIEINLFQSNGGVAFSRYSTLTLS